MSEQSGAKSTYSDARQLGVKLFNKTWSLIDKTERTVTEDLEMIDCAHASAYHWSIAPESTPSTRSISRWQLAHVYTILRHNEEAMFHAALCRDICLDNGIGGFEIAFAYEAIARAAASASNKSAYEQNIELAEKFGAAIEDKEDREHFQSELAKGPWFGMDG